MSCIEHNAQKKNPKTSFALEVVMLTLPNSYSLKSKDFPCSLVPIDHFPPDSIYRPQSNPLVLASKGRKTTFFTNSSFVDQFLANEHVHKPKFGLISLSLLPFSFSFKCSFVAHSIVFFSWNCDQLTFRKGTNLICKEQYQVHSEIGSGFFPKMLRVFFCA